MNQKNRKTTLTFFLIIISIFIPIFIFMYIQASEKLAMTLKLPDTSNEIAKIQYSHTLIDNNIYKASEIAVFEKIFSKKDITSFSNKNSSFTYKISYSNNKLNVMVNDLSNVQCKSLVRQSLLNQSNSDILKMNGIKIKNMSWTELEKLCSAENNTLSALI